MKFLVTGVKGQLGYDICKVLREKGYEAVGVDIEEMDLTKEDQVRSTILGQGIDGVFHCAAYTAVDKAEDEVELCRKVNVDGTRYIATACKEEQIPLLYLSTDYIFHGEGENEWKEDGEEISPLNIYGQTKYEGEQRVRELVEKHFIVRISWVFGKNGANFIKTMIRLGKERGKVQVVADQIGSPTYTKDLAKLLVAMMESDKYGTYHATNEGVCSWYEFACEIFKQAGMKEVEVTPVTSEAFPTKAKRPHNSRMSKEKLEKNGFFRLPTWQDAVGRYLKEIGEIE